MVGRGFRFVKPVVSFERFNFSDLVFNRNFSTGIANKYKNRIV